MSLLRIGKEWKLMKGHPGRYLGLQKYQSKEHGLIFPVYESGSAISEDFFILKNSSIGKTVSVFKMRNKRLLKTFKRDCFCEFHEDNQDKILFLRTAHGIVSLFLGEASLFFIYITRVFMKEPESIPLPNFRKGQPAERTAEKVEHAFKKIILFKQNYLIMIDSYKILVYTLDLSKIKPKLTSSRAIKPYDIINGIACSEETVVLIGYKNLQVLKENKQNQKIETSLVIHHGYRFPEYKLGSVLLKNKIYISIPQKVFSIELEY